jgi:hypothetical protein
MSRKSIKKTSTDVWMGLMAEYKRTHDAAPIIERVVDWALENGFVEEPTWVNGRSVLIRRCKHAARSARKRDAKGRKVREVVPVKVEKFDEQGNRILCEVIYDWLHDASLDHLLVSFAQRDERINNQRYAATRDLESALEFNPNLAGADDQFKFDFMLHGPVEQLHEQIEETKVVLPQDQQAPEQHTDKMRKQKPR